MKPFDIEKAKAGAKVCLRNSKAKFRIVCYDCRHYETSPILVLIGEKYESVNFYHSDGRLFNDTETEIDLMLADETEDNYIGGGSTKKN